ncbi:MAG TPA: ATP-binding protein [Kofleriaceae bacterium]|nr:ATP-binding protein [Kofleriaceae bacterium]
MSASASPADSLVQPMDAVAEDLDKRVARHLLLRTLVITAVLGLSVWILANNQNPARLAMWLQSSVIAATYLSSIVFGVQLRRGVAPKLVARQMHANDLGLTTMLVFITGGAQSPYLLLYALTIVSAGALSYRRGASITTAASIIAAIAVSLIAHSKVFALPLGQIRPWDQSWFDFVRTLGINVAALAGVGALAFIFGDQLQKGAETLATTQRAAADLLTLHQDIVRSLSSGLITITPDGVILSANHVAADILGAIQEALVGVKVDRVMPGVSLLIADNRQRADLAIPSSKHGMIMLGVTVSPLRDVHDTVIGRVINFQDLTELRRLELHARRAERLATVGQLAAGIAHEIRNPLASISGSIELLQAAPQASDDDRALMQIVNREIQRLNVLIGDLLDYANPRPSEPADFDLGNLVEETVRVARGELTEITIATDVDKDLVIHADAAKLRQVVWNLVRNARDAAAAGGKHVWVEAHRREGDVTISVRDDGPGIPKELVARIFDPFVTTKQKGTGLGLATSHAVVAEQGGRIDVDTTATGTTMTISLPIGGQPR